MKYLAFGGRIERKQVVQF